MGKEYKNLNDLNLAELSQLRKALRSKIERDEVDKHIAMTLAGGDTKKAREIYKMMNEKVEKSKEEVMEEKEKLRIKAEKCGKKYIKTKKEKSTIYKYK